MWNGRMKINDKTDTSEEINMKNILVTGGAGFLGSNLCRKLLAQGHTVTVVDNLYTGRKENIKELLDHPRFAFFEHDISEPFFVKADEIYHAACPASPPHYQKSPVSTIRTCVIGMMNLLELADKNHARILQFSTSEVYGEPLVHPQTELYRGNVNPIGLRACYDEGKRCAETLCFDYYREHGTKIKVIRIFNTYGPYMHAHDGRVVSNFIIQALQNKDITVYGDGGQTRSFCYVDDLIDGIIRMMESGEDFIGPVNLGNPSEFTVMQLAQKVIALTDSKSNIIHLPLPSDDPTQRKPDIALAVKELGWEPKIDLETGLLATIRYFSKELSHGGI